MPFIDTTYRAYVSQAVAYCKARAASPDLYDSWKAHVTTLGKVFDRFRTLVATDPDKAAYISQFEFDHTGGEGNYLE